VSQDNTAQTQVAEISTQETKTFIRQVRTRTRRKYAQEDKIRIVLEGFRREVTVSDLCRREGIKPGVFYAWIKEFMEAGKERLTRDTVRDASWVNCAQHLRTPGSPTGRSSSTKATPETIWSGLPWTG
jgi:transposase